MSELWLWALFVGLLMLLLLGSLRLDWLRIWWRDQLEHPPGAANDSVIDVDLGEEPGSTADTTTPDTRSRQRRRPRPVAPLRQVADQHPSPAPQRPAYHRSGGRRH